MAKKQSLVVIEGPFAGSIYEIEEAVCTLGRAPDNTIAVDSPRVSRRHAQIRLTETGVVIEDMGSTNGTFVNGRQISVPYPLSSGDTISLADVVTFEYVVKQGEVTERFVGPVSDGSTQVMRDAPPLFSEPEPIRPARPVVSAPIYQEPDFAPAYVAPSYTPPLPDVTPERAKPRRPIWLYIVIVLLIILICVCVALAVYLWNAPLEFWEQVFDLLGIPMP